MFTNTADILRSIAIAAAYTKLDPTQIADFFTQYTQMHFPTYRHSVDWAYRHLTIEYENTLKAINESKQ